MLPHRFRRACVRRRQVDLEGRAPARFAVDVNRALVVQDDAVGHGEAQAGAATDFLGREEGLEDPLADLGRHAVPGIGDAEDDVAAGLDFETRVPIRFAEHRGAGLQEQRAAFRHRVPRIEAEIEQHLLQFARIGADSCRVGGQGHLQGNLLADDRPQHGDQFADRLVGIDVLGPQRVAAAETQQLAGERGRPVGGLEDLLQVLVALLVRGKALGGAGRIAADGLEEVVEFISRFRPPGVPRLAVSGPRGTWLRTGATPPRRAGARRFPARSCWFTRASRRGTA